MFETQAELNWVEALDVNGIAEYSISYDGVVLATSTGPNVVVTGLAADTEYEFTVTATDPTGNAADGPVISVGTAPDFSDTNDSPFEDDIAWLAARGFTLGCGGTEFCPEQDLSRAQMATLLTNAFDLNPIQGDVFTDVSGVHEPNINAVANAGISSGCSADGTMFCPDDPVSRGQMATFLANAFGLSESSANAFVDDDNSVHEGNIDAIAIEGITSGCLGNQYCPLAPVKRGQLAAFLHRGFVNLGLD